MSHETQGDPGKVSQDTVPSGFGGSFADVVNALQITLPKPGGAPIVEGSARDSQLEIADLNAEGSSAYKSKREGLLLIQLDFDIRMKRRYGIWLLAIVSCWFTAVLAIISFAGGGCLKLSDTVLLALLGTEVH